MCILLVPGGSEGRASRGFNELYLPVTPVAERSRILTD